MKSWDHMKRLSKKSLCAETPQEHAETGCKKTLEGPGGSKKGRIKKLLARFGKGFRPPSGHQSKFSNYAQSWLKSDAQLSLHRNFMGPKKPPLVPKRVFFRSGYLGVMYCPP